MFVLQGFCQVVHQLKTRGRFRSFSFQTPEGYHFERSLWITDGLLEEPIEGDLFSFVKFCPSPGTASLTTFRRITGIDPALSPSHVFSCGRDSHQDSGRRLRPGVHCLRQAPKDFVSGFPLRPSLREPLGQV
ncbi:MAG: hypothetical protein BJ554DRAFT_5409 [Olpidium bornovanus]|uniref:Uncharacterized protein n=1 Tax=Olpidium bornovanus TaxID=278681 RepID=A0A8H8A0A8_9FUNG|nr:MAG: hypothetical protein BJ554DRAFT_5409 [Olpidium bornovanus]